MISLYLSLHSPSHPPTRTKWGICPHAPSVEVLVCILEALANEKQVVFHFPLPIPSSLRASSHFLCSHSSFSSPSFFYPFPFYVYVYTHFCICVGVGTEVKGQRSMLGIILSCSSILFSEAGFTNETQTLPIWLV